jgi:hypothetical protein
LFSFADRIPRAGRAKQGVQKLGFPWILSSESSLFNELRWISLQEISRALLPAATERRIAEASEADDHHRPGRRLRMVPDRLRGLRSLPPRAWLG